MTRSLRESIRMLAVLTLLTGVAYPFLMTGIAQVIFPREANGSMIMAGNRCLGSELVGQKFSRAVYFWPRPSTADYNPLPSGGSNLAPTSATLASLVSERHAALASANGGAPIPSNLLYASGSGLDPHITPEAAYYQVERVARARGLDDESARQLNDLVARHIEGRTLGMLGEPRVNVLLLNMALDSLLPMAAGESRLP